MADQGLTNNLQLSIHVTRLAQYVARAVTQGKEKCALKILMVKLLTEVCEKKEY